MEAARGSQGTVAGSKCPPSSARQLSAFPGQCPPVVRLLFLFSVFARQFVFPVPCPPVVHLLPTSSPPSPDPAHQLSAFPGPCPPVVCLPPHPARQLSAFPGPCPSVLRLHISELGIQTSPHFLHYSFVLLFISRIDAKRCDDVMRCDTMRSYAMGCDSVPAAPAAH